MSPFFSKLRSERFWLSFSGFFLIIILFFGLSFLNRLTLKHWSFDWSEENIYTLPPEAELFLSQLDTSLDAYFYRTEDTLKNSPLESHAEQILRILRKIESASNGKVRLHLIDPEPFSEEEDNALLRGVRQSRTAQGEPYFLGLSAITELDDRYALPFFSPDRKNVLIYDILSLIYRATAKTKPKVGFYSSLPLGQFYNPYDKESPFLPQQFFISLTQLYTLQNLPASQPISKPILDSLDALVLVQPDDRFSAEDTKLLQDFMDRGGQVLLFLDPIGDFFAQETYSIPLLELLDSYGLIFSDREVVVDLDYPQQVTLDGKSGTHYGVFDARHFASDNAITAGLFNVTFASAGYWRLRPKNSTLALEALLKTSEHAQGIDKKDFTRLFLDEPPGLEREHQIVLAASAKGIQNDKKVSIVVVGDTSLLLDRMWLRGSADGSTPVQSIADNHTFVLNALDRLTGNETLLKLRQSPSILRPFGRIEELKTQTNTKTRHEKELLQEKIQGLQSKLGELERLRLRTHEKAITPQRQQTIDALQEQLGQYRLQVRKKNQELFQKINDIYARWRLIIIFMPPLSILIIGVSFLLIQKRRRYLFKRKTS